MIYVELLDITDYDDYLVGWWAAHGWPAPPRDFLPDNGKGGFMVWDENTPICAGYMYSTNSKVAWCDWVVGNPEVDYELRREALQLLVDTITDVCQKDGYKYIYALINHDGLKDIYRRAGYNEGDNYQTEMIWQSEHLQPSGLELRQQQQ